MFLWDNIYCGHIGRVLRNFLIVALTELIVLQFLTSLGAQFHNLVASLTNVFMEFESSPLSKSLPL